MGENRACERLQQADLAGHMTGPERWLRTQGTGQTQMASPKKDHRQQSDTEFKKNSSDGEDRGGARVSAGLVRRLLL